MAKQFEQQSSEILNKYIKPSNVDDVKESEEYKKAYDKLLLFYKANNDSDKLEAKVKEKIGNKTNTLEKIKAFNEALLESENNQNLSKDQKNQIKKEAEEKGFSWEKISKAVEENGGWFSWAGFTAGIGALFSDAFSGIFGWVEEKIDDLISKMTGESEGTFDKGEYISEEEKLNIKFKDDGTIENIFIDGKEYVISEGPYTLGKVDGKQCLVGGGTVLNNVFALNYLGKYFDEVDYNDNYSIDENTEPITDGITGGLFNGKIEFKSIELSDKVEKNILKSGDTKIFFKENIDKDKDEQELIIEKLEINGYTYELTMGGSPKELKFNLIKRGNTYYLDFGFLTPELEISKIASLVNKSGYKLNEDDFYLYKNLDKNKKYFDHFKDVFTGEMWKSRIGTGIIAHRDSL